jgi:hypothetical protein
MTKFSMWLVAVVLLSLSVFTPSAYALDSSAPSVQQRVKAFTEAVLRRPLTSAEWEQILAEDAADKAEYNEQTLSVMEYITKTLRDKEGTAAAFHLRHIVETATYFEKKSQSSPIGQKFLAIDPVAVVDRQHKRILTAADVRGVIAIRTFMSSDRDPRDVETASAQDVDDESDKLQEIVDNNGMLTDLGCEAAAFWAGVTQNWDSLSAADKKTVRAYAKKSLMGFGSLPDRLQITLLGLSPDELKAKKMAANSGGLGSSYTMGIINNTYSALSYGNAIQNFSVTPY